MRGVTAGLALLFAGAACSPVGTWVRRGPAAPALEETLAVAPPLLLSELPGAVEKDAFAEQMIVGHVHLSGGYVEIETERGIQYRSKNVEVHSRARYTRQARQWLAGVVEAIASERMGGQVRRLKRIDAAKLPAPKRIYARGSGPLDRRDDQNLPRYALRPRPLTEAARAQLKREVGSRWLLLPILVYYYSHNGGWFIGQTLGTGAGARGRVFWVLYDLESGEPVHYGEVEARRIDRYVFSPNSTQVEDYLIAIEEGLDRALRGALLR
ncbi:MAG: hypothetical protein D6729_08000 [Deltaproteobacteria bacterium]|nr:MAG: hypothetical protein D6729_08000 [Deltaproteobacteria bacterium]